jgi:biotin carboxylase
VAVTVKQRVLIGFAESLAAVESAWCLADAGFDVVAYTRDGKRPALAASRRVRVFPVPAPEKDIAATVTGLRHVIARTGPDVVLPLDDQSVMLTDQLAGASADDPRIAGPTGALARIALDKRDQLALAEKAGFAVPPTVVVNPGDTPATPDRTGPWIVKCALATVTDPGYIRRPGGGIARTLDEVSRRYAEIAAPTLIQPVIGGVGEGVFGIAVHGEVQALSAHRRIRMMNPRGSGSSAARSIPVDPALAESARRFVAESGWEGIFMLEFLRDAAGRPWFMELNGRTWGSMALARHRGWPYPVWAVEAALDPHWRLSVPPEGAHLRVRHLGREIVHLLAVLRGARGADVGRWPSRGSTIAAMLKPERGTRWYHARPGELRVLARDTWNTVAGQVRKGA